MKISGSGVAHWGMVACNQRRDLRQAKFAISCLHDALLAVAQGKQTPEQIKDFFWGNDFETAKYYGDVITFDETPAKEST